MLWAIDVGNTQTVIGIGSETRWDAVWRFSTQIEQTEDELTAALLPLLGAQGLKLDCDAVIIASVVPGVNDMLSRFARKSLNRNAYFVTNGDQIGIKVDYSPKNAVGADRLVNALAGKSRYGTPLVVVDFGTATTFDAIDRDGVYVGGAILPGIRVSMEALVSRTAKLPQVQLTLPDAAIGKSTPHSLQSGLMFGYVASIESLAKRISGELGGGRIVATGGDGRQFAELCPSIELYDEWLTLGGLRDAYRILVANSG